MSVVDRYTLGRTLGSGFSAKVKVGTDPEGNQFALKIFRHDNPQFNQKQFKLLKEEVEATTQMDHRHVVKYYHFMEHATMIKKNGQQVPVAFIAQEMVTGGELFDYVANSGPFEESVCKYYFKQMLQAVHYIHAKGFSHRDLKPENILLDKNFDIKLVDFGFACPLEGRDGSGTNRSVIGTPGYMAPEILQRQPYQGQVVDVFALGVILFILYSGHPPFSMANEEDTYYKLLATNRSDLFWKAHANPTRKPENFYSEHFKDLITCMLQFHPHQRLCIADIVGHPWLSSGGAATPEAVRAEFAHRQEVNKRKALEEEERKRAQRDQVSNAVRRDFQLDGKVYLSAGEDLMESGHASAEIIRLTLKEFEPDSCQTHAFFSTYRPDYLLNQLTTKMREQGQEFEISDQSWKIKFDVSKKIVSGDGDNEQEQESGPFNQEYSQIQVQIMKVRDQDDKYCVSFSRKAGSSILFYDNANKYIDLLELCNNATLDS